MWFNCYGKQCGGGLMAQPCPTLVIPRTGTHQAPPSMSFPGNYTGVYCHFLLQGNLANPAIKPGSPTLQVDSLRTELVWEVLKRLNIKLPNNPSISLLSIYPKEMKARIWTDTNTNINSSIIHKRQRQKQPKCTSTDKWTKCSIYIQYYSAFIKRSDFLITATTWMNLKGITLSKLD